MAAASFIPDAENELSCPICFELFVDPNTPKNLPVCGHVCCEVCLEKMVAGKCDRTCPNAEKSSLYLKVVLLHFQPTSDYVPLLKNTKKLEIILFLALLKSQECLYALSTRMKRCITTALLVIS